MRFWLFTFRYVVPAVLVLFGLVYAIVDWPVGAEALSLFAGAGLSILLLNVLFRVGARTEPTRSRPFLRYRWCQRSLTSRPSRRAD